MLKHADEAAAKTSKKDKDVRRKELKAVISPDLVKLVEEQGEELLRETSASLLVAEILLSADGGKCTNPQAQDIVLTTASLDKSKALETIATPLKTPYPNPAPADSDPDPATAHILDLGHAVRTYKTLLAGGRFSTATSSVEDYDEQLQRRFANLFYEAVTCREAGGAQNLANIALGNATFALLELLSALKDDKEKLAVIKQTLRGKEILPDIEKSWRKGAKPLYEALKAL